MSGQRDYYFSHDFYARDSLAPIQKRYGIAGCGAFWHIVEWMHCHEGKIEHSEIENVFYALRFTDEESAIAKNVLAMEEFFENDGTAYISDRVLRNLKKIEETKEARRDAGIRSGEVRREKAKAKANEVSDPKPNDEPRQEPRQEESQGCKMTLEQAQAYARIDNLSYIDPNKFHRYYGTKTWKNEDEWKAVMRRWNETDKAKMQKTQPNETSSFTGDDLASALARSYAGTGIDPTKD